ncbi:hypothetical protein FR943_12920 [Mycobacterium sp. TNTM28]|uniref:Uncharacterized protein n=1 Tax=[Mycobacterium] fortunisiensis TaxID=2600579 RepID=A0ABS6KMB9_9MYCO|nr:hypothetical protein [[Mycobacterium] fortunisiensis]MBU9764745.1 hypothetical protein [[Mycobacterium] fortunisiensis]
MTTDPKRMSLDELDSVADQARAYLAHLEQARADQPERLAKARSEADEARGWSLIEEPWNTLISALPTYNSDGQRTGDALMLPSITGKELFGARLAFDMLDCGEDQDRLEEVKTRYFTELRGDTGLLFLVCMAALDTIAGHIVPQMVDELETHASNYDVRVMLAEARTKAWNGRVSELRGPHDEAGH